MAAKDRDLLGARGVQNAGGRSSDAMTMRDPSGLKAAEVSQSLSPRRTAISLALAASQMRAVWSKAAVTMRDPSGLNAAEFTSLSWPRRTAISFAWRRPRCGRSCPLTL